MGPFAIQVRIYRKVVETLDSLKGTLEAVRDTAATKRARLAGMRCRRFLCAPETAGRVASVSMQYVKRVGYLLFAGYADGRVRQWDVRSESVVRVFLTGGGNDAACLCFGGDRMFTAGEAGPIKVWSLAASAPPPPPPPPPSSGEVAAVRARTVYQNEFDLVGHEGGVLSLRVCGNLLLSAAADGTVRVWNLLACDFGPPAAADAATDLGVGDGDEDGREDGLMTARSGRSSISVGSGKSMFSYKSSFGGSVSNELAARVISISIFDESVEFRIDDDSEGDDDDEVGAGSGAGGQRGGRAAAAHELSEGGWGSDGGGMMSEGVSGEEADAVHLALSGRSAADRRARRRSSVGLGSLAGVSEDDLRSDGGGICEEDVEEEEEEEDGMDGEELGGLAENLYIDLFDMAGTLPGLDAALRDHVDAANRWSRRAAPPRLSATTVAGPRR